MPRFENNVLGLVPQEEWLDIGFDVSRPGDPIDSLIGDLQTDNLVAAWESIAAEYNVPLMAQFHGFDTEAQQTFRIPVDSHNIEKGLIKVKINQSERMRALLRSGVQNDDLYDYVLNDGIRLADQVVTRSKVAKNELLATGKVTIKENGLDLTVDYGVPSGQLQLVLDFTTGADPIADQIEKIVSDARAAGITLNGLVTSRKVLNKLRKDASIQKAINGVNMAGVLVSNDALKNYLSAEFGLDTVITNDLTYAVPGAIGSDGRPTVAIKRYFPENVCSFFGANANGKLGDGLWGDPPETDVQQLLEVSNAEETPFVFITQWSEHDPAVLWTKASALFMPVLYNPNALFVATVQEDPAGELEEITVASAAGSAQGKTALTISEYTPGSGESYVVKIGTEAPTIEYGKTPDYTWQAWDGSSQILFTTGDNGKKIAVVSIDSDGAAIAYGSTTLAVKTS